MTKTNRNHKLAMAVSAAASLCIANGANATVLSYFGLQNSASATPFAFQTTGTAEIFDSSNLHINIASQGVYANSSYLDLSGLNGTFVAASSNGNWNNAAGNTVPVGLAAYGTGNSSIGITGSGSNGSSVVFATSAANYQDLTINYDWRASSTGHNTNTWSYSTDGVNYTALSPTAVPTTAAFSTLTVSFAGITALNNAANVYFKVTASGAVPTTGTGRWDNFVLNGTAVGLVDPAKDLIFQGTTTWNTAAGQWKDGVANVPWTDTNNAVFSGLAGTGPTVNVSGDKTVSKLKFTGGNYTLNSSAFDTLHINGGAAGLAGVGIDAQVSATVNSPIEFLTRGANTEDLVTAVSVSTGATLTLGGQLYGSATINKIGAGTLVLTNTSNAQNVTKVTAGTLSITDNAALGSGDLQLVDGTLQLPSAVTISGRTVRTSGNFTVDVVGSGNTSTINGNGAGGSFVGSGNFTKTGAGTLVLSAGGPLTPNVNAYGGTSVINQGTVVLSGLAPASGAFPPNISALGSGLSDVNNGGTLLIDSVLVGRNFSGTGLTVNLNNGGTLAGTSGNTANSANNQLGEAGIGKSLDSNLISIANNAAATPGSVTLATKLSTDLFTIAGGIRQRTALTGTSGEVDTNTTIHVAGPGTIALRTGYRFVQTSSFAGSWSLDSGTLQVGPLTTTGFQGTTGAGDTSGEALNALGNKLGRSGFGNATNNAYIGNLVTVNSGASLAIAVDAPNPALFIDGDLSHTPLPTPSTYSGTNIPPTSGGAYYLRNPIVLNGGSISATDFQVVVTSTNPTTGAATGLGVGTTAVQGNIGGDLTISGTGSKFLTYDAVGGVASTAPNRNINLLGAGNTTWNGQLIIDPGTTSTTGVATFARTGGTVAVGTSAALQVGTGNAGTLATAKFDGLQVTSDGTNSVALSVQSGGKVLLADTLVQALHVKSVAVTGTGKIDVTDGFMVVDTGSRAAIDNLIKTGKGTPNANGLFPFNGNGITSSTAATLNTAYNKFVVASVLNSDLTTAYTAFGAIGVTPSEILVRYTYNGDANLDGKIDTADYALINAGFGGNGKTGWVAGDFNLDGFVNALDYAIIDFGYLTQGAALGDGGPIVVPEPTSLSLIALGGAALMGRRRRNA